MIRKFIYHELSYLIFRISVPNTATPSHARSSRVLPVATPLERQPTSIISMFSLIRRISYGVIPRPDRPWEDDRKCPLHPLFISFHFHVTRLINQQTHPKATSNAPRTRRKRRLSSTEREAEAEEEEGNRKKKARGDSATPTLLDLDGGDAAQPQPETQEVKEVTKGVQEVDLQGETATTEEGEVTALEPESVPLPEETTPGELDEPGSDASTPPPSTEVVDDGEASDASGPIDASETDPESQKLEEAEEGDANKVEETK